MFASIGVNSKMTSISTSSFIKLIWGTVIFICVLGKTFAEQTESDSKLPEDLIKLEETYYLIPLKSSILEEDRELWVFLPKNYQSSKEQYPVIYLLDGRRHFQHAITAVDILQSESMVPQSIIVAVTNHAGNRNRDFNDGKEKFLSFLKQEVFSIINKTFRTTEHKTLFGHSLAGYFTLNVLATEPELFNHYIVASPAIDTNNSELLGKFEKRTLQNKVTNNKLYFTLTSAEAEGQETTDALNQFVIQMNQKAPQGLSWQYVFIPNQAHMTTPYLTFYQGLSYIYEDFRMPSFADINAYQKFGGLEGLNNYYKKRAAKYGTDVMVPERTVRRFGYVLLGGGQLDKAIDVLQQNVANYPQSLGALNGLADGYVGAKDEVQALDTYRKALSLAKEISSNSASYFESKINKLVGNSEE
jgi:predicted alpha/beta superfamily hydrolase